MKFQAISILTPAVENIINGSKSIEIRSWYPETIPLKNVILVQNDKYLKNQSDIDHGWLWLLSILFQLEIGHMRIT